MFLSKFLKHVFMNSNVKLKCFDHPTKVFVPTKYYFPSITKLTHITSLDLGKQMELPSEATLLTQLTELSLHKPLADKQLLHFTNLKSLSFLCNSNSLHLFTNLESLELNFESTFEEESLGCLPKLTCLIVPKIEGTGLIERKSRSLTCERPRS